MTDPHTASNGGKSDAAQHPPTGFQAELELALWSDYVDKLTVSVVGEFDARGISSILLKGPAIARWLYSDGPVRPYGDADLMVSPRDWSRAQALLGQLGFEKELAPLEHPGMESMASEAWVRGADNVDLHCTLWAVDAEPQYVWDTFWTQAELLILEGRTVRMLGASCRTLLLATHLAKHGDGQPLMDLERAVDLLPLTLWSEAAELAAELDAIPAFVAGLRLVGGGRKIIRDLGLPDAPMAEASLREWRVPMALGLEQLARTRGTTAKLRMVWHELFPNPAFMRWWTPLARTGRLGLGAAYAWRLVWVGRNAVPAYRAWRRARAAENVAADR